MTDQDRWLARDLGLALAVLVAGLIVLDRVAPIIERMCSG